MIHGARAVLGTPRRRPPRPPMDSAPGPCSSNGGAVTTRPPPPWPTSSRALPGRRGDEERPSLSYPPSELTRTKGGNDCQLTKTCFEHETCEGDPALTGARGSR